MTLISVESAADDAGEVLSGEGLRRPLWRLPKLRRLSGDRENRGKAPRPARVQVYPPVPWPAKPGPPRLCRLSQPARVATPTVLTTHGPAELPVAVDRSQQSHVAYSAVRSNVRGAVTCQ
jgi:hypothetical protein